MTRAFNFCAGPATLPTEVLEQARDEMLDWQGRGISVMETSHRNPEFMAVAAQAERDLRDLLAVPDHYHVLFMQGGASAQFAAVPLNLLGRRTSADYLDTGYWSTRAIREAARYCRVNVAASSADTHYVTVPEASQWRLSSDAAYVHCTPNETIGGLAFAGIPDTGDIPLVADMSSSILSGPLDINRFGLVYASAQKNIGPAGITLVILREDLTGLASDVCPSFQNYQRVADNGSMLNTPPTFAWYLSGLVFQWLRRQGGLSAVQALNQRKAGKLYAVIDGSDFYHNPIEAAFRSIMNVPFRLADDTLDSVFLREAEDAGLLNLKGHREVGGMRASIYNAVPEAAVDALVVFMSDFERRYG